MGIGFLGYKRREIACLLFQMASVVGDGLVMKKTLDYGWEMMKGWEAGRAFAGFEEYPWV